MSTTFTPEQFQNLYNLSRIMRRQDVRVRLWKYKKTCRYCGERIPKRKSATLEHVLPTSRGGDDSPENLTVICYVCNHMKGDRTLSEWRDHLLLQVAQVERFMESRKLRFDRG